MRRGATVLVILLGCGGTPRPAPPIAHEAGPPDDAPADTLAVVEVGHATEMECARHDLALRAVAGGAVRAELVLEGGCVGACTEAEKAAGEATVAEIQAGIAAGTHSESELDYDFTGCVFHGVALVRWEEIGGRRFALLFGENPGPHDIPTGYFRLATVLCGNVWLSEEWGATYANRWQPEEVRIGGDDRSVTGAVAGGELYRATFEGCDPPVEVVADADAIE